MPPRSSFSPRRIPAWLSLFCFFPKSKVNRRTFYIIHFYSGSCFKIFYILSRKAAIIIFIFFNFKINVSVYFVSISSIYKTLNYSYHVADMFCSSRSYHSLFFKIYFFSIFKVGIYIFVSNFFKRNSLLICSCYHFIVHICKVLNISNFVSSVFKISSYSVKKYCRTSISNMDIIVDCRSAYIH